MSDSNKFTDIISTIRDQLVDADPTSLDGSKALVTDVAMTLKTSNIIADVAETHPALSEQLHDSLQSLQQMETLIAQMQAAELAGDTDAMQAIADQVAAISGTELAHRDPFPAPYEALNDAIESNDMDKVRAILAERPDLNTHVGEYSSFPLAWAMMADNRNVDMLRILVEGGADVRFATPEGYTALHFVGDYSNRYEVTEADDYAVAAYLVEQGAELEARNHYGWTPLHRAVIEGVPAEVSALLRVGADPNALMPEQTDFRCAFGLTALSNAAADPEVVALLLDHGADPARAAPEGMTLLGMIDEALAGETEDGYKPYYDGLRHSRTLIEAALRRQ